MYKNVLLSSDAIFDQNMTLPANDDATCSKVLSIGKHGGGLALYIRAASAVTLAATKAVTVSFETTADGTTFVTVPESYTVTFATALSLNKGDKLLLLPLPDFDVSRVRVTIATDDSTASGKVDVALVVLAR